MKSMVGVLGIEPSLEPWVYTYIQTQHNIKMRFCILLKNSNILI